MVVLNFFENNAVLCISKDCLGLKKVLSDRPGQVDSPRASTFLFSLAQWAKDHASRLPTKSLKEQTNTCPGQAIFERYWS